MASFFSFSGSKLTAYILPVLPGVALLVGVGLAVTSGLSPVAAEPGSQQSAQVPVVRATNACFSSLIRVTGFLVDRGDCEAMAEKILTLLGDPGLRQTMGCAGRRKAEILFDLKKNVAQLVSLYGIG